MYAQPTGSITNALNRLRQHIAAVPVRLQTLPEAELTEHAPGKWSRKETLGHLIDSALNNLKRFTDAQFADGVYQVQAYNQNQVVIANQYQTLSLDHLVTLWSSLNTQIVNVSEKIPAQTLARTVQVGKTAEPGQTLGWLIEDYVAHLEHHLKTLL